MGCLSMRIPKIVSTDSKDIVREDTYNIGYFDKIKMVEEAWKQDETEMNKYIKRIEKMVRSSYEYRDYIKFLKDEIDMNKCAFFPNLSREDVSLEIHHAPFTLYDITAIVLNETRINDINATTFDVANKVMKLHYEGMVGLIPLSITVHQLVHNGDIFIPIDNVHGDVKGFYEKYKNYMTSDQLDLLKRNVHETNLLNKEKYNPTVLERRYTYIDVQGMEYPKPINRDQLIEIGKEDEISLDDM